MKAKDFFGKFVSAYLWGNLLAMFLVIVALAIGVKYGLAWYTHHGEGIEVPKIEGMSYADARLMIDEMGLNIIVSDSGYNKALPANSILLQTPGEGQKVKKGHIIYVTVNSPSSPSFALPDLVDNSSFREAEARLTAMGFRLNPPQLVDGEKDWVYGILCRGRRVSNGDRVSIENPLTLMVGKGTIEDLDDIDMVGAEEMDAGGETDDFEEVKEP